MELLAPIERPGKYLAIGMNYAKHLEEADRLGVARAKYQTWFNKQTTCLAGPYDEIETGVTEKLDYECELAAVIGKAAKLVSEGDAKSHVFGYTVANDVSARDWQFHTPTFTMGKSFDTHGPIGRGSSRRTRCLTRMRWNCAATSTERCASGAIPAK